MFDILQNLFGRCRRDNTLADIVPETAQTINWDNPDERMGASLYLILSKQFDLIGKPEGVFPYTAPFATDKARGALLGTAISVVKKENVETPHQAVVDAAVTAFVLAYGNENGRFYALQTLRDSADGNEDVNFASDWAIKDTDGANSDESPAAPAAFYMAVAKII